jgi:hypothetical protein
MRIVSVIVVCFAPCSGILVVGDVLEQCLVAGSVLGVVRLEVCLIESLLPWSSGKSERRKCSTLCKLITSINESAMGGPKSINLDRFYCIWVMSGRG